MVSMAKLIRSKQNLLGGNLLNDMRTQQKMVNILAATYSKINIDTDGCEENSDYYALDNATAESFVSYDNNVTSDESGNLMSIIDSDRSSWTNPAMDTYAVSSHSTQANSLTSDETVTMPYNSSNTSEPAQVVISPAQLTNEEFNLLETITKDNSVLRETGDLNWEKVHAKFMEQAIEPDNNIYNRTKDRLIRSYRKYAHKQKFKTIAQIPSEITESVSFDVHSAAHPTNLTSLSAISSHEPNLESHVAIVPLMAIGPIENSSRIVVPYTVRDDDDDLDPEERDFVQTYGKDRMKEGHQVDKKLLWKAYREKFPQWSRNSEKIKRCWDNWKGEEAKKRRRLNT